MCFKLLHDILTCWCTACEASVRKQRGDEGSGWKAKHKALRDKHSLDSLGERYSRGHPCRGVAANRSRILDTIDLAHQLISKEQPDQ
eukprot:4029825-Amphidinium_carterae.1